MRSLLLALPVAILMGIAPPLASDAAHVVGLDGLAEDLGSVGTADAAFIRRTKLRKKRTVGYRVVVVVADDEANEVDSVDVSIAHGPDQPTFTGGVTSCDDDGQCSTDVTLRHRTIKANGNKRFRFNDLDVDDIPYGYSYSVTTTLVDAEGLPLGPPESSTLEVEEAAPMGLRDATIRQVDDTFFEFKAVVLGDFDDTVQQVYATLDQYTGPDPEPDDSFAMGEPVVTGGTKVFSHLLSFSGPATAVGELYTTAVQFVDADGVVGAAIWVDIVVEGLPATGNPQGKFIKKFKGKTKFDRKMNETITDEGRVTTNPGETPSGMSVGIEYELIDSGLILQGVGTVAENARVQFDGVVTGDGPYLLAVDYNGTVDEYEFDDLATWDVIQISGDSGTNLRVKNTGDAINVVVHHEMPDWDPSLLNSVTFGETALEEGLTRWSFETIVDITGVPADIHLEGAATLVTSTVYDADGTVLDRRSQMEPMGELESEDGTRKLRITQTNSGNIKVVAWTRNSEGGADALNVAVIDDESGDDLLSAASASPRGIERQYRTDVLTFEEPDLADDAAYVAQIDVLDADGGSVGTGDVEVIVGGAAAEFEVTIDGGTVAGVASITRLDETNFELSISLLSGRGASVAVALTDQGGPAAVGDLALGVSAEWCKWILKGNAGIGSLAEGGSTTVQVTVVDAAGAVRDVEGGIVDVLPKMMFAFGKGTKSSTSQASIKPDLL
jgi:hypothetical protein